jgi:hypothetical protein
MLASGGFGRIGVGAFLVRFQLRCGLRMPGNGEVVRPMPEAANQSYGGAANDRCIVLINGAFGVGKSTVASAFHQRAKGSRLYDPEQIGYVLRRLPHWIPGSAARLDDYRTSPVWRALNIFVMRLHARSARPLIVPMSLDLDLLDVLRRALTTRQCRVVHVCLVAPEATVRERLTTRGVSPTSREGQWVYPRALAACRDHSTNDAFAYRIDTEGKDPIEIVDELATLVGMKT